MTSYCKSLAYQRVKCALAVLNRAVDAGVKHTNPRCQNANRFRCMPKDLRLQLQHSPS